jgi:hypothetical protein
VAVENPHPQLTNFDAYEEFTQIALEAFEDFAAFLPPEPYPTGIDGETITYIDDVQTHVDDYLVAWLESGNGIEVTGGSFDTFLSIVMPMADAILRQPCILDYHPSGDAPILHRPVQGLINPDGGSRRLFDRRFYEQRAFRIANFGRGVLSPGGEKDVIGVPQPYRELARRRKVEEQDGQS